MHENRTKTVKAKETTERTRKEERSKKNWEKKHTNDEEKIWKKLKENLKMNTRHKRWVAKKRRKMEVWAAHKSRQFAEYPETTHNNAME